LGAGLPEGQPLRGVSNVEGLPGIEKGKLQGLEKGPNEQRKRNFTKEKKNRGSPTTFAGAKNSEMRPIEEAEKGEI